MDKAPAIAQAKTVQHAAPANPFRSNQLAEHANVGTITVESERAIAEVQAKMVVAKRFPRDEALAYDRVIAACSRPSLAAVAEYRYPRGGQQVSGPSIRLAEELARCYGNIVYGIRELSRKDGVSEMQAFAWDLETNVESTQNFTVRHIRDKNSGNVVLTDERDIYEITANMGGRRLRARLLAILPPDLVEAAVAQCRQTLAGGSQEPIADRIKKMINAFKAFNVTSKHLSDYLGKKLDDALPEDIADLQAVYTSIRDGQAKPSDYFGAPKVSESTNSKPANDNQKPDGGKQESGAPKVEDPAGSSKRTRRSQKQEEPPAQEEPAAEPPQQEEDTGSEDGTGSADDEFDGMFGGSNEQ